MSGKILVAVGDARKGMAALFARRGMQAEVKAEREAAK